MHSCDVHMMMLCLTHMLTESTYHCSLVSATAMYEEQRVIDFLSELLRVRPEALTRPLRDFDRVRFSKEIKGESCLLVPSDIYRGIVVSARMAYLSCLLKLKVCQSCSFQFNV